MKLIYSLMRRRQGIELQLAKLPQGRDTSGIQTYLLDAGAQLSAEIENVRSARSKRDRYEVLYFPYSRVLDPYVLRLAVLLFEKIWFLDYGARGIERVEYSLRDVKGYYPTHALSETWRLMKADYDLLQEADVIGIAPIDEIAVDCERTIGLALLRDLEDQRLAPSSRQDKDGVLWAMAVGEFPWLTTSERITVLPPCRPGKHSMPGPGNQATVLLDLNGVHGSFASPPPAAELVFLSDLQGASIRTTQALILSATEQIPLFTDYPELVNGLQWRSRVPAALIPSHEGVSNDAVVGLGFEVLRTVVDRRRLSALPIRKLLQFRRRNADGRQRFWRKLTALSAELASFSLGADLPGVQRFVATKVLPELEGVADGITDNYETLFGALLKKAGSGAAGGASIAAISQALIAGVSTYQLLGLGGAAAVGSAVAAVPAFVDAALRERRLGRHGLVYVLQAARLG
jgi:hypothetical protein